MARILLSVRDIWWSRHYRTEMPPNKTTNIPPRGRVKTICPETVFDTNPLNQKAKSLLSFLSRLLKYGSSDWTRTSDIRINSPPFYRLNYRGIVVEAYVSGEKFFVKPHFPE